MSMLQRPTKKVFDQIKRLIELGRRDTVDRLLNTLPFTHPTLSKMDQYELKMQAMALCHEENKLNELMKSMAAEGVRPTRAAMRALLKMKIERGQLEEAEDIVLSLPKWGVDGVDCHMMCLLIVGWGKRRDAVGMQKCEDLFLKVPELHGNVYLATAMMTAYLDNDYPDRAIALYDRLRISDPDPVLRKLLVRCLFKSLGREQEALTEWEKIKNVTGPFDWLEMIKMISARFPEKAIEMTREYLLIQAGTTLTDLKVEKATNLMLDIAMECAVDGDTVKQLYTDALYLNKPVGKLLVKITEKARAIQDSNLMDFVREQVNMNEGTIHPFQLTAIRSRL